MNDKRTTNERGQSLILVAGSLVVLVMFVAVAVDLGSAYWHRRIAQNGADGAALGGVSEMALEINHRNKRVDLNIEAAMNHYAERNGIEDTNGSPSDAENSNVEGWYVDMSGNRVVVNGIEVRVGEAPQARLPDDAYGVEAITHIEAPAFFGGIFGVSGYPIQARAVSLVKEACGADCLVPIVTQMDTLFDADGELLTSSCFNIWSESETGEPGSFGWAGWTWQQAACDDGSRPCPIDQGTNPCDTTTLINNLDPINCASGYVIYGDWVANSTGVATASGVRCYLDYYLGLRNDDCSLREVPYPVPFTIPVYDYTNVSYFENSNPAACGGHVDPGELDDPSAWGLHYHVAGFAKMQLLGYLLSQGESGNVYGAVIADPAAYGLPVPFDPEIDCVTLGDPPHDGNRITAVLLDFVEEFVPEDSCVDPTGTLLSAPKLTE